MFIGKYRKIKGKWISSVTELNAEEKIEEVARMLSGATVTEEALSAAKNLLKIDKIELPIV